MHSAVQIPPLTKHPPTMASCNTWGKNTEGSDCSQKALGNCASSTVQPASYVALSDHNDAIDSAFATAIPLSVNFVSGIPFRTDDSPNIRVQRAVRQPSANCPIGNIVLTDRDKQLLSELLRASAMALPRCVVSRHATAWAESLEGAMSGHQSWALLCRYRCRLLLAQIPSGVDRNAELAVGNGASQCSDWPGVGSAELLAAAQNSRNDTAAVRRTAREASVRLNNPRLNPQSHEGPCRWRCTGLSRLSSTLDYSPHPSELGHWHSSHQCGVCRGSSNCLERWKIQTGTERDEGARTKQNRHRLIAPRQAVANECSLHHW